MGNDEEWYGRGGGRGGDGGGGGGGDGGGGGYDVGGPAMDSDGNNTTRTIVVGRKKYISVKSILITTFTSLDASIRGSGHYLALRGEPKCGNYQRS